MSTVDATHATFTETDTKRILRIVFFIVFLDMAGF